MKLASIIVNNYNYAQYLRQSIDSALAQTYERIEVIVVDDGSTDGSRQIIESYGERVFPVFKPNGGQGSAFNAGFAASRGDVIIFLDSDDLLLPTAMERVVKLFENESLVKVHWPLMLGDEQGSPTGETYPGGELMEGDLRLFAVQHGPCNQLSSPGGGCAWSREYLSRILPLPEQLYRVSPDTYLFELAPFMGPIRLEPTPQTIYRQHGSNSHTSMEVRYKIELEVRLYEHYSALLRDYCRDRGVDVDMEAWRYNCWWLQYLQALDDLEVLRADSRTIALIDGGCWEVGTIAGCQVVPFQGPAVDDAAAIAETERLLGLGASHLVIAWPGFWWLDYYTGWRDYLARFDLIVNNERVLVYDLGKQHDIQGAQSTAAAPAVLSGGKGLLIYQWRTLPGKYLAFQLAPDASVVHATPMDPLGWLKQQLEQRPKAILFHLNCSVTPFFPGDRAGLTELLAERQIPALNANVVDVSKRSLQLRCAELGLNSAAPDPTGDPAEQLILKTNSNYAGRNEILLSPGERSRLQLPPETPLIKSPLDYRVLSRSELDPQWWTDPALAIERFISNDLGRSYRAMVCGTRIAIIELCSADRIRKMGGVTVTNVWMFDLRSSAPGTCPSELVGVLDTFVRGYGLDFGAIDVLEDANGGYFVVDVNPTPHYSKPIPGVLEFLRGGLEAVLHP